MVFLKLNSDAFQEICEEFFQDLKIKIKTWIPGSVGVDFGDGLQTYWSSSLSEFKNPSKEFQVYTIHACTKLNIYPLSQSSLRFGLRCWLLIVLLN